MNINADQFITRQEKEKKEKKGIVDGRVWSSLSSVSEEYLSMPLRNSLATMLPGSLKSAVEFGFQPGKVSASVVVVVGKCR